MRGTSAAFLAALLAAGCASPRPVLPAVAADSAAGEEWGEPPATEEPRGPERTPRWVLDNEVHATWIPYVWRTEADGDQSRSGLRVPHDGEEETAGGLRFEASLARVAWGLDAFYTTASGEEGGVESDLDYFTARFAAHMRVLGPPPQALDEGEALDLVPTLDGIVGVRAHFADGTIDDPAAFSSVGRSVWWGEPVAGLRGSATVLRRLTLFGRAEGGGIDVGRWRSWSWDLEAGVTLRLTENLSLAAAYRWYGASYRDDEDDDDPWEMDTRLSGPWVGLVLEF